MKLKRMSNFNFDIPESRVEKGHSWLALAPTRRPEPPARAAAAAALGEVPGGPGDHYFFEI